MIPIRLAYDDVVLRVREDISSGRARFVARINTPWHVLGLEAWVHGRNADCQGTVVVSPNTVNAETTTTWTGPLASLLASDPRVTILVSAPRTERARSATNLKRLSALPDCAMLLAGISHGDAPIDLFGARQADVSFLLDLAPALRRRRVRLQILDEGFGELPVKLGTHTGPALTNARLRSRGSSLRHAAVLLEARVRAATARLAQQRFPIFERNLIKWDPLEKRGRADVALRDAYRTVLMLREPMLLDRPSPSTRLAIFATHAVSEYLNASADTETRIAEHVVGHLLSRGYDVIIKPHPRERLSKYGFLCARHQGHVRALANTVPAEHLFRALRTGDVVVGYTGQSVLSANLFFGLPAYSVTSALSRFDFNTYQRNEYRAYDSALREFIRPFDELDAEH